MGYWFNLRLDSLFLTSSGSVGNVIWMLIAVFTKSCWSFNIDVTRPLVYKGNNGTNFGAAVDLLNNTDGKWLLVGAPLDSLSYAKNYSQTGNVFLCPVQVQIKLTNLTNCTEIGLTDLRKIVSHESRLGASLMVLDDTTLVCAPGFKNVYKQNATSGACVYFKNNDISDISGLLIRITNNDSKFSWSMFGFSMAPGINETFPYTVGGPNSGHQEGGLATFTTSSRGLTSRFVAGTTSIQPGSYFGFSLDSGLFDGDKFYYVAGRPGFANKAGNIGNVEILEFFEAGKKTTKKLIAGKQLGGGFGYSVCVADVNGDSIDDVLIGAPLEYINQSSGSIIVDSGSVYIYLGTGSSDIIKDNHLRISGMSKPWARFGTAIIDLRDISNDGISDIAIGAPFEDDHRGTVYIYNGKSGNFTDPWDYSQRISPDDLNLGIRAFGFSLSRSHVDIDDNLYTDLAVSGYKTDQVVILRTRPVVHVEVDIISTPESIPINSTGYECNDGNDYPCVTLHLRFRVTGKGIENGVYMNYTLLSDEFSDTTRFFLRRNNSVIGNFNNSQESQMVLLKPNTKTIININLTADAIDWRFFQSLTDPVSVHLMFSLADITVNEEVPPILHSDVITSRYKTLEINTNCSSYPCKPDYVAHLRSVESNMTLQRNQELEFLMYLTNAGDPAYKTDFYIETFPKMDFYRITEGTKDLKCTVLYFGVLHCIVHSVTRRERFYAHQRYKFMLKFFVDPDAAVARKSDHVKIEVIFNSTMEDEIMPPKTFEMISYFNLHSDVRVIGGSDLSDLIIASTSQTVFKYSVTYDIHNEGPSPLGANLNITIASSKGNNKILKDITVNRGNCTAEMKIDIIRLGEAGNLISQPLKDNVKEETSTDILCGLPGISCTYLICDLGFIKATEFESVELTMDLDSNSFSNILKDLNTNAAQFVTPGELRLYNNKIPASINVTDKGKVALRVSLGSTGVTSSDLLWYAVGGSVGGFLFLVIIALILWKCGFFNRKKRGEIDRAKRQSQMKQRQSRMMSQFVSKELNKGHESSINGTDRGSQGFRQSTKKDYPDLDVQDR
ncbi:integrin alpha-4-like isoform X2 [Saccostrea echinata]|uniref:integrin alpha-4-like isoform X2 n=1 Tax=Saccostrea echinata TaxID=191078 RepID=UPI002A8291CB|nr:integrin alpha-4-like isoform X2 [Saccostrea echinata]